jgi:hypothetical protein
MQPGSVMDSFQVQFLKAMILYSTLSDRNCKFPELVDGFQGLHLPQDQWRVFSVKMKSH